MISIRFRSLLLPVFFAMAAPGSSQSVPPVDVLNVGSRDVQIPSPTGFLRCDGIDPEWDKSMQAFFPASNRLLATYGTPADHAALKAGKPPVYTRNCNLQVTRSLENQEIGEHTFAGLRDQMKSQLLALKSKIEQELQKVVSDGTGRLNQEQGTDVALQVSNTAFIGIFEDTGAALGFTMAMNANAKSASGGETKSRVVVATIVAPVNGRMVNFYATSPYTAEADRTAAEKTVAGWRDAVVAANPRVAGPEASSDWVSRATRAAIIGGVIGALVVIAKKVLAKKKAPASQA